MKKALLAAATATLLVAGPAMAHTTTASLNSAKLRSKVVTVTGTVSCPSSHVFDVAVKVVQKDGSAAGEGLAIACTGNPQAWRVNARTVEGTVTAGTAAVTATIGAYHHVQGDHGNGKRLERTFVL